MLTRPQEDGSCCDSRGERGVPTGHAARDTVLTSPVRRPSVTRPKHPWSMQQLPSPKRTLIAPGAPLSARESAKAHV